MGQAQSTAPRAPRSHEQLTKELANRFAEKCFTSLELYSLKDNFRSLADNEQGVRYLKEDTVARFLGMPDVLGASPVVFQMLSYLGAFPFLSEAPAVLGLEQLVLAMTLLTERYRRVLLARGTADRRRLVFRSLAVHDRGLSKEGVEPRRRKTGGETTKMEEDELKAKSEEDGGGESTAGTEGERGVNSRGFAVDEAVEDTADDDSDADADDTDADSDELALAALDALDYAVPLPDDKKSPSLPPPPPMGATPSSLLSAHIPADNFRKLLMLLLLVAPLGPQERLSACADRVSGTALDSLRAAADCVLASFLDVETSPGIGYTRFEAVVPACFPHMLAGFGVLMEHFLFSKNLDFSAGATATATATAIATVAAAAAAAPPPHAAAPPPPVNPPPGSILNLHLLSQLSFFLPGDSLFHRLRPLYSGDNDGFSLGSFETRVFNWRAPTILLVQGSRVSDVPHGGPETAFAAALPPRRFPTGAATAAGSGSSTSEPPDETLIFGAYVSQPWRLTNRECFGDSNMVLFQLAPTHDVFSASTLNRDYAAFVKPSAANQHTGGIGFGCPPATTLAASSSADGLGSGSGSASGGLLPRGPLSLVLDASFEFGVMTHDCGWNGGGGGGAFQNSVARPFSFQERFSIEALEVWGCGGDTEARVQAERWAWEAREAEARRRINLGTGDLEADRALLEMAGLIGTNRSGGSMG